MNVNDIYKTPGQIMVEDAYAQGKMLDHSGFHGRLPRNITPSDVDMVIESQGYVLFCELSSSCNNWPQLKLGQKKMYENIVRSNPNRHLCALLTHGVIGRKIDTFNDILSVSVMCGFDQFDLYFGGPGVEYRWPQLAINFCRWPEHTLREIRTGMRDHCMAEGF